MMLLQQFFCYSFLNSRFFFQWNITLDFIKRSNNKRIFAFNTKFIRNGNRWYVPIFIRLPAT